MYKLFYFWEHLLHDLMSKFIRTGEARGGAEASGVCLPQHRSHQSWPGTMEGPLGPLGGACQAGSCHGLEQCALHTKVNSRTHPETVVGFEKENVLSQAHLPLRKFPREAGRKWLPANSGPLPHHRSSRQDRKLSSQAGPTQHGGVSSAGSCPSAPSPRRCGPAA